MENKATSKFWIKEFTGNIDLYKLLAIDQYYTFTQDGVAITTGQYVGHKGISYIFDVLHKIDDGSYQISVGSEIIGSVRYDNTKFKGKEINMVVLDEASTIDPNIFKQLMDERNNVKFFQIDRELIGLLNVDQTYVIEQKGVVKTTGKYLGQHKITGSSIFKLQHDDFPSGVYKIIINSEIRISAKHENGDDEIYLIQDIRQYVGNLLLWWGDKSSGYTTNFDLAGRYSKIEAESIMKSHPDRVYIWPLSYIKNKTMVAVDSQHISRAETKDELGYKRCAEDLMYQIASNHVVDTAPLIRISDYPQELVNNIAAAITVLMTENDFLHNPMTFDLLRKIPSNEDEVNAYTFRNCAGWQELNKLLADWGNHTLIWQDRAV